MNKRLKSIIEDEQERGESRMTRLLKSDDAVVTQKKEAGSSYSLVIADLVHKGLAYEALEKGAKDPVIRNLLHSLNEIVRHRVEEATRPLVETVRQNQLFVATLFLTLTAKLDLPLDGGDPRQLDELQEACAAQGNHMLSVLLPPPADNSALAESDSHQHSAA